jgi:hypothetical protein
MAALRPYTGVYRLGGDHRLGIDRFISDNGDSTLLFCDYETGIVRPLFRISPTEFAMGPSFAVRSPVELVVEFAMDGQGAAHGLTMRPTGGRRPSPRNSLRATKRWCFVTVTSPWRGH